MRFGRIHPFILVTIGLVIVVIGFRAYQIQRKYRMADELVTELSRAHNAKTRVHRERAAFGEIDGVLNEEYGWDVESGWNRLSWSERDDPLDPDDPRLSKIEEQLRHQSAEYPHGATVRLARIHMARYEFSKAVNLLDRLLVQPDLENYNRALAQAELGFACLVMEDQEYKEASRLIKGALALHQGPFARRRLLTGVDLARVEDYEWNTQSGPFWLHETTLIQRNMSSDDDDHDLAEGRLRNLIGAAERSGDQEALGGIPEFQLELAGHLKALGRTAEADALREEVEARQALERDAFNGARFQELINQSAKTLGPADGEELIRVTRHTAALAELRIQQGLGGELSRSAFENHLYALDLRPRQDAVPSEALLTAQWALVARSSWASVDLAAQIAILKTRNPCKSRRASRLLRMLESWENFASEALTSKDEGSTRYALDEIQSIAAVIFEDRCTPFGCSDLPDTKPLTEFYEDTSAHVAALADWIPDMRRWLQYELLNYALVPIPVDPGQVQAKLDSNEVALIYLVGKSQVYGGLITPDALMFRRLEVSTRVDEAPSKALARKILQFRRSLTWRENAEGEVVPSKVRIDLAEELYRELVLPFRSSMPESGLVHIVKDGPIASLPFGVLLENRPAETPVRSYTDLDWLIKRYAFSTITNLRLLAEREESEEAAELPSSKFVLGVGNPRLGPVHRAFWSELDISILGSNEISDVEAIRRLPSVPSTGPALRALGQLMEGIGYQVRILEQNDASEEEFRAAPQLGIAHWIVFLTHAVVSGSAGFNEPAILLTPPGPNEVPHPGNDGALRMREIAELDLRADLVVLGACETASGSRFGSETLGGLARAFFLAGASSLLVTHWSVEAQSTGRFLETLVSILSNNPGIRRSEAVQRASLGMLEEEPEGLLASMRGYLWGRRDRSHPAYWAPFVLVGDGAAGFGVSATR